MLVTIGLIIVFLLLVSLFVSYRKSLQPKPAENLYPKVWGMNGYKHHEYKEVNF